MTRKRILNILKKEWDVIFSDFSNALFVTVLPVLIVAQGLVYIWAANHFGSDPMLGSPLVQTALAKLTAALPAAASLPVPQQVQVLLLSQFNLFLLLIPTMIAISFSTFGIVEEKLSRSLEPLLATPVRTWELLFGKVVSGAVPALVVTWFCGLVFLLGVVIMGWGSLVGMILTPSWFLTLFLLTPAIAVLSFLLGIISSSRAKDAKSAQYMATFVILPVFALIAAQLTGVVWFNTWWTLGLALGICLLDFFVLKIAVKLFQRESIVIKWK